MHFLLDLKVLPPHWIYAAHVKTVLYSLNFLLSQSQNGQPFPNHSYVNPKAFYALPILFYLKEALLPISYPLFLFFLAFLFQPREMFASLFVLVRAKALGMHL